MELVLLVAILASVATNFYLVRQTARVVYINVPPSEVHVSPPETQLVFEEAETITYNFEKLEEVLQKLTEAVLAPQNFTQMPLWIEPVVPAPTYYPVISEMNADNHVEINGVPGKQFPVRQ